MPILIGNVTIIAAIMISNSSHPLFQKVFVRGEPESSKVIRRFGVTGDDGVVFQNAACIFISWRNDQLSVNRPSTFVPFRAAVKLVPFIYQRLRPRKLLSGDTEHLVSHRD